MVKLVAIDLDGTLYNSDSQVSDQNKKAIWECLERNIKVIIVTGKTMSSVSQLIDQLKLVYPQVVSGGSAIIDKDKKVLFKLTIPTKLANEVVHLAREYDKGLGLSADDGLLYYEKDHPGIDYIAQTGDKTVKVGDLIKEKITSRTLVFTVTIDVQDEFNQIIAEKMGQKLKLRRGGPIFLNLVHRNAGKAFALKKVLSEYNIDPDQVAAIGDNENDMGMLNLAGIAVAMQNAPSSVKQVADYIVSDNNNHGVAEALEKYVLDKEDG